MPPESTPHERALPGFGVALVAVTFLAILAMLVVPVIEEKLGEGREDAPPVLEDGADTSSHVAAP